METALIEENGINCHPIRRYKDKNKDKDKNNDGMNGGHMGAAGYMASK
jgi:hypothetical protein